MLAAPASSQAAPSAHVPRTQSPTAIETSDGATLFCRVWGAGRPIVFVHGWAVNCDIWQYQMVPLSSHALCVAYDKRGHGRSSDPGHGYGYDRLADDLATVLEKLDLTNVTLVGHSMGPAEIVRYLSRHGSTRVSRLVLISSALPLMIKTTENPGGIEAATLEARRLRWLQDMPRFLAENARAFVTPDTSAETVAWVANLGMQASLKALLELNHTITETDLRSDVARVKLPALIIHGAQDKSAPLELTGRRTAALIQESQLRIYEDAPHGLLLTHQERLNSELLGWINS